MAILLSSRIFKSEIGSLDVFSVYLILVMFFLRVATSYTTCILPFIACQYHPNIERSSLDVQIVKGKNREDYVSYFNYGIIHFSQDYYGVTFPGTTAAMPGRDGLASNLYSGKCNFMLT